MYEAPIAVTIREMCEDIAKKREEQQEDAILREIYGMGISVDKEELIKALKYDRNQYERGYRDGYEDDLAEHRWISVSERLPEEVGAYMTTVDYEKHGIAVGQRYYHGKGLGWEDDCVIAWMPLPEPYKAESEDKKR